MAVAMDLGNVSSPWGSIHPNDKQDVGERLALAARGVAYEEHVYYTGPIVAGMKITAQLSGNQAEIDVLYSSVGVGGLEIKTRKGFEVSHLDFLKCFIFFRFLKGHIDFHVLQYIEFKSLEHNIRSSEITFARIVLELEFLFFLIVLKICRMVYRY